jgi:hypothetical protein
MESFEAVQVALNLFDFLVTHAVCIPFILFCFCICVLVQLSQHSLTELPNRTIIIIIIIIIIIMQLTRLFSQTPTNITTSLQSF